MSSKPKVGFTQHDLNDWVDIMQTHEPDTPTHAECIGAPALQSFSGAGSHGGMGLCLSLDDQTTVTICLNPSIAQMLIEYIRHTGQQHHWITAQGKPGIPTLRQ